MYQPSLLVYTPGMLGAIIGGALALLIVVLFDIKRGIDRANSQRTPHRGSQREL